MTFILVTDVRLLYRLFWSLPVYLPKRNTRTCYREETIIFTNATEVVRQDYLNCLLFIARTIHRKPENKIALS